MWIQTLILLATTYFHGIASVPVKNDVSSSKTLTCRSHPSLPNDILYCDNPKPLSRQEKEAVVYALADDKFDCTFLESKKNPDAMYCYGGKIINYVVLDMASQGYDNKKGIDFRVIDHGFRILGPKLEIKFFDCLPTSKGTSLSCKGYNTSEESNAAILSFLSEEKGLNCEINEDQEGSVLDCRTELDRVRVYYRYNHLSRADTFQEVNVRLN
jgi:hypothetical protein